jgi:L-ascorbate metabolism protein UlaG (beta-lactamase superfamily)
MWSRLGMALLSALILTAAASPPGLHRSLERHRGLMLPQASPAEGRLRVRFMGVSTLLLEDGDKAILVDGFFSRPKRLILSSIKPDAGRIDTALRWAGASRVDAVLVAHSHYDHAMDSAVIAKRFGALLVGSRSTAMIAPADELGEKMKVVKGGDSFGLGRFRVTAIASRHGFPNLAPGSIERKLEPPAHAYAYKEGTSLSYLVEHGGLRILIHGTAGFGECDMNGIEADVVLMGVGGVGLRSRGAVDSYWHELVRRTGARLVIPIHWDNFLRGLDRPLKPMPGFNRSVKALIDRAGAEGRDVRLLQPFVPSDIGAAVPPISGSRARLAPSRCSGRSPSQAG